MKYPFVWSSSGVRVSVFWVLTYLSILLIRLLLDSTSAYWLHLACGAAVPKFALVLLGLVYVLLAWSVGTMIRTRKR